MADTQKQPVETDPVTEESQNQGEDFVDPDHILSGEQTTPELTDDDVKMEDLTDLQTGRPMGQG